MGPMSTVSTQPVPITVTLTSNLRESTSTITRLLVVDSSQELSSWISNQERWTLSELAHSVNSSDQTTSSSVRPVPVTTGPRVITPKVLNSLTPSSMLSEKKPKVAIVSKVSKSPTPSVVVLVLVWVPSSSPRSERNIQTESWRLSPSSHLQRSPTPSSNLITLPSPSPCPVSPAPSDSQVSSTLISGSSPST